MIWLGLYLSCRALEEGVSPCISCFLHGPILKLMLHLKAFTQRVLCRVLYPRAKMSHGCTKTQRGRNVFSSHRRHDRSQGKWKGEIILQGREGENNCKQKYRNFPAICHHLLDWPIFLNPPGVNLHHHCQPFETY